MPRSYDRTAHMPVTILARFAVATILMASLSLSLSAQTFTGSISGRVTDSTGLPVSNVRVVVLAVKTNDTSKTVTNNDGEYSVAFLKPDTYTVSFTIKGFKEIVQNSLELQLNQEFRLNQVLDIGSVTDKVEVTASATDVNYDSPEAPIWLDRSSWKIFPK